MWSRPRALMAMPLLAAVACLVQVGAATPASAGVGSRSTYRGVPVYESTAVECVAAARDPRGVLWIGDSITAAGRDDIVYRLRREGRLVCLNARAGRTGPEGLAVLRSYGRSRQIPRLVVMALGTNDTTLPQPSTTDCLVRSTLATVGRDRALFWVNVHNHDVRRLDQAQAATRAIDLSLATADSTWLNLAVVDWRRTVRWRPSLIQADGVHPTWEGNRVRTTLTLAGLDRLPVRTGMQTMPLPCA